ncbi:Maf family protein [Alteromonas mediterranea]|uniref:dTTP/UTP pyrophosphatase n=1 Tax=Alteromonas mediterranea (strain DSM 17117 / CIP 110805 / LMG 28347 / Deep ecotype) TaxID=1774373 RepID=F2G3T2_ALTMD|nr:Maf family protein [Alteromonas mediterranea]AGP92018.1 septum formation protein Maf [Alteromonas mediterranea U8]AEA96411.1 septum formation protein Maf [Alteromonas mediterranea DE]AGP84065.1 septum formation protein Maf [Alteromonas mediterranea U4]AGP88133.1 septum formation protein Maf [Alteromonas mediterranea U7]CAH1218794.1 Maf-like protein YhdE [Alteromonas mediterranea]|tara:strand:- start:1470 stop:2060 length:591 start_codon:yes stop_codon:yes gene_type:complete
MTKSVVLASASPRRTALLKQMNIAHTIQPADIDESPRLNETPLSLVSRLAAEKGLAVKAKLASKQTLTDDTVILASDTLIAFNGQSVGKPENKADAKRILTMLSGNTHEVLTAISVLNNTRQQTQVITTSVTFAALTNEQITAYWETGEPADKAGSYAIQGIGGEFVVSINGSASAVIGLPLYETRQLLNEFGVVS